MAEPARVLVASDSLEIAAKLSVDLRSLGHEVSTSSIADAAERASSVRLAEVIVLHAPHPGEVALLYEQLRRDRGDAAPAVIWVADSLDDSERLLGIEAGASYCVDASGSIQEIGVRLGSCLRTVRALRALDNARRAQEREAFIACEREHRYFDLLASVSHEIRTPLTSILGYADLLRPGIPASELEELIDVIRRSAGHLLAIVDTLLDFAKIEAGGVLVRRTRVSVPRALDDVRSFLLPQAQAKGIEFEIVFDSPIPETIETDATRLRQVLVNLAANAIKFTRRGEVRVVCRVVTEGERSELRFEIHDTGPGISAEELRHLFVPFHRIESAAEGQEVGHGLGLAISRRLARLLGGEIEASSTKGQGSTFVLVLPFTTSSLREGSEKESRAEDAPAAKPPAPESALHAISSSAQRSDALSTTKRVGLAEEFVKGLPARIECLAELIGEGDLSSLARIAHELKGSAGTLGYEALAERLAQVERSALCEDYEALAEKLARVRELARHVRRGSGGEIAR